MAWGDTVPWDRLEAIGPAAFGLGGLSILVNVALLFATSGELPGWLNTVLGLGGLWLALVGLIGY